MRRASSSSRSSDSNRTVPPTLSSSTHPSSDPFALSEAFQAFYATIEEDLRASDRPLLGRGKEEKRSTLHSQNSSNVSETLNTEDNVESEVKNEYLDSEIRVREILEQVESVICCAFYDRFVASSTRFLIYLLSAVCRTVHFVHFQVMTHLMTMHWQIV